MGTTVQNQIKLPLKVAFQVVMQGIRIRLGRSVVTLTGVICGIAFLMSILTGQVVKHGLVAEDAIRNEVRHMHNLVLSDIPSLKDRTASVLVTGALSEPELRLLETLHKDGLSSLEFLSVAPVLPRPLVGAVVVKPEVFAVNSVVLFVLGDGTGTVPSAAEVQKYLQNSASLATTQPLTNFSGIAADRTVNLKREISDEERAKLDREAGQERFRNLWIGILSLLVTVIGISNAMLMSVTERFREIGTMKCLGALSGFIRQIFLLESFILGFCGGIGGAILGMGFSLCAYSVSYGMGMVLHAAEPASLGVYAGISLLVGVGLSMLAAVYPAWVASRMVPAVALRSNV